MASATPVTQAPLLSSAQFTDQVVTKILQQRSDLKRLPPRPGHAPEFKAPTGRHLEATTSWAYQRYKSGTDSLEAATSIAVRSVTDMDEKAFATVAAASNLETARDYITPALVPLHESQLDVCVHERVTPHLEMIFLYDHPKASNSIRIADHMLRRWHMSKAQLRSLALRNLDRLAKNLKVQTKPLPSDGEGPLYCPETEMDCNSVLALAPSFMDQVTSQAHSDLRVWLPKESVLYAVSIKDKANIQLIDNLVRDTPAADHPLTTTSFIYHRANHSLTEVNP